MSFFFNVVTNIHHLYWKVFYFSDIACFIVALVIHYFWVLKVKIKTTPQLLNDLNPIHMSMQESENKNTMKSCILFTFLFHYYFSQIWFTLWESKVVFFLAAFYLHFLSLNHSCFNCNIYFNGLKFETLKVLL